MINISRRRLFSLSAALVASTAAPALMWHASPLNVDRIVAALVAQLDAQWDNPDMQWTPQEIEDHKKRGAWPEYGSA